MKQFTLKLLNKVGLTFISESNNLIAYKNNTIQQLKNNSLIAKSEINELNNRIKNLKELLNKYRITKQRINKIKYVDKLNPTKLQKFSYEVRKIGKCDICSTTQNLTAHHLYDKVSHPTLAYTVENGVCLCEYHHKNFHDTLTDIHLCTPKHYLEYKNRIFKGDKTFKNILDNYEEQSKLSA